MKNLRLIVENVRVPITASDADITEIAKKTLSKISFIGRIISADVYKKSVDARRKNDITFVCSVVADAECEKADAAVLAKFGVKLCGDTEISFTPGREKLSSRPVVIGFGPAGMFASLFLAKYGLRPLVLERGDSVEKRTAAVELFNKNGILDPESNIQFGAGGAGTFSDGKLTTRIGDPFVHNVLKIFSEMGAPDTVLKRAKPHIGTDVLCKVVSNIEKEVISLGGEIRYRTKVTEVGEKYVIADGEKIEAGAVVLAVGHSARDLYASLAKSGYSMNAKPFSVGVRVEHLTRDIDRAMYGDEALSEVLGHAEYALSYRKGERGAYTFCMCPGGVVVAAASESGGVVTNGMSNSRRDGKNSNAAVAVSVLPSDFGGKIECAVEFQRNLERAAFVAAGSDYSAPCQTVSGLYEGKITDIPTRIKPSYRDGKVVPSDFNKILPGFVTSMLKEGLSDFGRKVCGYNEDDVPLTGVETRTSAPLRIIRGNDFLAEGRHYVYPCGEGAGYAGGIVSAAVDGIRVAGAIISRFSPEL